MSIRLGVLAILLLAVGGWFSLSRRPDPLEPRMVAEALSGRADRVMRSATWARLGVRPPGLLFDVFHGLYPQSASQTPVIRTTVRDADIDGDGFEDAFLCLNVGASCSWVVLMQKPYEGWACVGVIENAGSIAENPHQADIWPRLERHGGATFLIVEAGAGNSLDPQGWTDIYMLHDNRLEHLWGEITREGTLQQEVTISEEPGGIQIKAVGWRWQRDVERVDQPLIRADQRESRWWVRSGRLLPVLED